MPLRSSLQFQRINEKRDELARLVALTPGADIRLRDHFYEELIFHAVGDRLGISREAVRDHLLGKRLVASPGESKIQNIKRALDYLVDTAKRDDVVDAKFLVSLHRLLVGAADPRAGHYREEAVRALFPGHEPPSPKFVERALSNTFTWLSVESFAEIHPIEQAALVLMRLLEIQPFSSENGLLAELTSFLSLLKRGFPLPVIRRDDLPRFHAALEKAFQIAMQELIDFYARIVERSLEEAVNLLKR